MKNDRLEEIQRLYFNLVPLFHKCKNFYFDKKDSTAVCNKNQTMAIMIIGKAGRIMPTTLSKFINMEKGSLTTLIDSLEQKRYIIRIDDPGDRRKKLLSLTAEGEKYMKAMEERYQEKLATMLENLDEDETEQMYESLSILEKTMRKISERMNT